MRIAVNTRFLLPSGLEGIGVYTHEIVQRMVRMHPGDHLHCFFDRTPSSEFKYGPNVHQHHLMPPARHPILFYIWFQLRTKSALARLQPDVYFSPDSFMPIGSGIPSVITVHDPAALRYPEHVSKANRAYYRKYMPMFTSEASKIITVSEFSKREIIDLLEVPENKVDVIYNGVSPVYRQRPDFDKSTAQAKWSGGKPYILYVGAIHPRKNVARLILGYERFREENPDLDHQLVIGGRLSWKFADVEQAYEKSRFKNSIHFTGFVPEEQLPDLVEGAELLSYLSYYEGFGLPVIEAMASGVPVLTSKDSSMSEISDGAAFLVDPFDIEAIAAGLGEMILNSELRNQCIDRGAEVCLRYSWDETARQTYEVLKAVSQA